MALHPLIARRSALVSALVAACAPALRAQTDVTVELGASQVGSPVGGATESSRFGVAGLRASYYSLTGSGLAASILAALLFGYNLQRVLRRERKAAAQIALEPMQQGD